MQTTNHLSPLLRTLPPSPTPTLLSQLRTLSSFLQQKQLQYESSLHSRQIIQKFITHEEALELDTIRKEVKDNEKIVKIVQINRGIQMGIVRFEEGLEEQDNNEGDRVKGRLGDFGRIYELVGKIQEEINLLGEGISKGDKMEGEDEVGIEKLKEEYFLVLKEKLYKAIVQLFYSKKRIQELKKSLEFFKLPIKKAQNNNTMRQSMSMSNSGKQKQTDILLQTPQGKKHAYCIIQALFCQYCCFCLDKKIQLLLDTPQQQPQQFQPPSPSPYSSSSSFSKFFPLLFAPLSQSLIYIFINPASINQPNNAYQIDQPNWLFQYMEEIFRYNYLFICEDLMQVLATGSASENTMVNMREKEKGKEQKGNQKGEEDWIRDVQRYVKTYFIGYNIKEYFFKFVVMRLETDMKWLAQVEKGKKKIGKEERDRNAFIVFNFLDQLHVLSQKINQHYDFESNLVQLVLLWSQKHSEPKPNILSLNFDYQHNLLQQRIFNDFSNINYSQISNLKNIQAYNITINFTHIFQKLYSKFRKISTPELHKKINQFYYEKLLQLVRHVKTSFERIYHYGDVDKYEVLMGYRKVQEEFRAYFGGFIALDSAFEAKIKEEYYDVIGKFVGVLALQRLNSVHKEVYKRLSENNQLFCGGHVGEESASANKKKWNQIFQDWRQKMSKINKLEPGYEDKKLRNIFFVFLESIQFSQDGFYYFISIFQPFLIAMFSVEGTNIIKMLLDLEKGTLKQYCRTHQNSLWFLTSSEIRSIQRSKISKQKVTN